jgi:hypothetical protein
MPGEGSIMRKVVLALSILCLAFPAQAFDECKDEAIAAALAIEKISRDTLCSDECDKWHPVVKALSTTVINRQFGDTKSDDTIRINFRVVTADEKGKALGSYKVFIVSEDIGFCTVMEVRKLP